MHSATAFHLVKLAGAGYLVWLGLHSLRSAVRTPQRSPLEVVEPPRRRAPQHCFLEGFLSNVLNPKAAVFYLAFLPQFIGPTEPVLTKSLLLASIHYVEGLLWLAALSVLLDHTRRFILHATVRRWLDGLCGAVLVGCGARLALERQSPTDTWGAVSGWPYVRKLDKNGNVSTAFQEPMLPEIVRGHVTWQTRGAGTKVIVSKENPWNRRSRSSVWCSPSPPPNPANTDTSTIYGEFTDLREAVAYLRKLADEIATEMRSEPRSTHNPSR